MLKSEDKKMVTTFAHRTILLWSQTIFPWELVFLVSLQLFHESSFLSNSFSYTLPLFPFMSVVKSSWATDSTSSYGWYTSFDQSHSRTYSLTLPLLGDTLKMKMQELSGILLLSKKAMPEWNTIFKNALIEYQKQLILAPTI